MENNEEAELTGFVGKTRRRNGRMVGKRDGKDDRKKRKQNDRERKKAGRQEGKKAEEIGKRADG